MKVGLTISGGVIFVLGLATALLSIDIYAGSLGATGWHMPRAVEYLIQALEALERTHGLHRWLLYFGLGNMVVGLALLLTNVPPFPALARSD